MSNSVQLQSRNVYAEDKMRKHTYTVAKLVGTESKKYVPTNLETYIYERWAFKRKGDLDLRVQGQD